MFSSSSVIEKFLSPQLISILFMYFPKFFCLFFLDKDRVMPFGCHLKDVNGDQMLGRRSENDRRSPTGRRQAWHRSSWHWVLWYLCHQQRWSFRLNLINRAESRDCRGSITEESTVAALLTDIRLEIWTWLQLFHFCTKSVLIVLCSTTTGSNESGVILF